jgi:beta-glucosidase
LSPAQVGPVNGQAYDGALTAPQTGTYVLALKSVGHRSALSVDGAQVLADPGLRPTTTYSVGISLRAGQKYAVRVSGGSIASLSWATPSDLAPGIVQAVAAAKAAKTAVVVVSDNTESEATDRASLNLPSAQNELISAVGAANPRTVVVIDAGAPVVMPWLSQVASVVDAWYPGESNGTALAAVLFGQIDPGGHLPVTFPVDLSQVPESNPAQFPGEDGQVLYSEGIDVGYRYYDADEKTPLFPFGYGLSYTRFAYSGLTITPGRVPGGGSDPETARKESGPQVTVSARVTNTGRVAGSDVVQLYLGDPPAAGEPPRQLKGFSKVALRPGQSTTLRFTLTAHDLSYWDSTVSGWSVPDGQFGVYVGDSSALANLPLRGSFTVTQAAWPGRIVTVPGADQP